MIVLCHRDTRTNATGLRGFPSAPRETGFNAHVAAAYQICIRLNGILMFATIGQARTSMCLSEVPRPVSCKGRISIRRKSKPSLGTIRRNEKATFYALARSGREREARGRRRFAKWLYRASCCKPSRRTHVMSHRKVVLVTGASSGFGKAIAGLLAKRDLEVFGTSRHPSANGSMPGVSMGPLDVRMDESVRACVDTILDRTGHLDILVNNAGYVQGGAIEEVTLEQAKAQFETNFFGAVRMVKAVLPTMRKQGSGGIINISSVAGLIAAPFLGFYNASKFALEGYT